MGEKKRLELHVKQYKRFDKVYMSVATCQSVCRFQYYHHYNGDDNDVREQVMIMIIIGARMAPNGLLIFN